MFKFKKEKFQYSKIILFIFVAGLLSFSSKSIKASENLNNYLVIEKTVYTPLNNYKKTISDKKVTAIGKPGPILSKVKVVNGRNVCKTEKDHPQKSKKNKPGHIDGECCLDPDETPNSLCYYPPERYGKMLNKYLSKK